jgi:hypothetical protein
MLEKIVYFFRTCVTFLNKNFFVNSKKVSRHEISREEKIKILREAESLIQRDKALMLLYEKLAATPRDGTQKRNFERSEIQLKILSHCSSLSIATGVISLAEIKSRKLRDETKLQSR